MRLRNRWLSPACFGVGAPKCIMLVPCRGEAARFPGEDEPVMAEVDNRIELDWDALEVGEASEVLDQS